jgi:hypothetical protein
MNDSHQDLLVQPPVNVLREWDVLKDRHKQNENNMTRLQGQLADINGYLELAPRVTQVLQDLSSEIFAQDIEVVTKLMTQALQDILKQPIEFKAEAECKNGIANLTFWIERDGNKEDIERGQGGSVSNILSTGLRILALDSLEGKSPERHRKFLVLDEQDCWLKPDLVPAFVRMIHETCKEFGFQVLYISHHEPESFMQFLDKVYTFEPRSDGSVEVKETSIEATYKDD